MTLPLELETKILLQLSDPRDVLFYCNSHPDHAMCREKNHYLWKQIAERLQLPHDEGKTFRDEIVEWLLEFVRIKNLYRIFFTSDDLRVARAIKAMYPDDVILGHWQDWTGWPLSDTVNSLLQQNPIVVPGSPWGSVLVRFRNHLIPDDGEMIKYLAKNPDGGMYAADTSNFWIVLYFQIIGLPLPPNTTYKQVITIILPELVELNKKGKSGTLRRILQNLLSKEYTTSILNVYKVYTDKLLSYWPLRRETNVIKSILVTLR